MSEVPHDVRGSSFEMQTSWLYFWVQQVLRALPAETKVDSLPRAFSHMHFLWWSGAKQCAAGGEPSTWLPPGELVEQLQYSS